MSEAIDILSAVLTQTREEYGDNTAGPLHTPDLTRKPPLRAEAFAQSIVDLAVVCPGGIKSEVVARALFGNEPTTAELTRMRRAISSLAEQGKIRVTREGRSLSIEAAG
jgi:hypothetical protein